MTRYLSLLGLLLAAGCATTLPPPVETRREVAAGPDVAMAAMQAALDGLGFAPAEDGVRLRAAAPEPWADCATVTVRGASGDDGNGRRDFARPQTRRALVAAGAVPAGDGSIATVDARFSATYLDRYVNLPFTRGCRSQGVLEQRLLDAAAAAG